MPASTYRANRRAVLAQGYWRALGLWSPDDWALPFVVRSGGEVVGAQWLEGPDWRADRTVDSSSWLVAPARGRGLGKQMRAAVLALAFGPLRADAAVSSAVVDNGPSLGVSRALGYRDTHRSVLEHSGETLQHVRLERGDVGAVGPGPRRRHRRGLTGASPLRHRGGRMSTVPLPAALGRRARAPARRRRHDRRHAEAMVVAGTEAAAAIWPHRVDGAPSHGSALLRRPRAVVPAVRLR